MKIELAKLIVNWETMKKGVNKKLIHYFETKQIDLSKYPALNYLYIRFHGKPLRIPKLGGKRTISQQNDLYNVGRFNIGDIVPFGSNIDDSFSPDSPDQKLIDNRKTVTNLSGSKSYHVKGLAFDVIPRTGYEQSITALQDGYKVGGALGGWESLGFYEELEKDGFVWGGRWSDPYDPAHLQINEIELDSLVDMTTLKDVLTDPKASKSLLKRFYGLLIWGSIFFLLVYLGKPLLKLLQR